MPRIRPGNEQRLENPLGIPIGHARDIVSHRTQFIATADPVIFRRNAVGVLDEIAEKLLNMELRLQSLFHDIGMTIYPLE